MDCQHGPCTCTATDGPYCGEHCRQVATGGATSAIAACGCGHAECEAG
jgi:hypothetical protein